MTSRAGFLFGALVAGMLALGLGGCSMSRSSAVSVLNATDHGLYVQAWFRNAEEDARDEVLVDAGQSSGVQLGRAPEDTPVVVVRVRPDAEDARAQSIEMMPPSPYLLRITGQPGSLRLEREYVEPEGRRGPPDDPRERSLRGPGGIY